MKRKLILALILTVCFSATAFAAPVTVEYKSLEQLIKANNPTVKSAQESLVKAREKAYNYTDPAIDIVRSMNSIQEQYDKEISEAEKNGRSASAISLIRADYEAQLQQLENTLGNLDSSNQSNADSIISAEKSLKRTIESQVSTAQNQFVSLYTIDAEIKVSECNIKTYKTGYERAKLLVKYGKLANTELDSYRQKVTDEETALAQTKNRKELTLLQLKVTIGLSLGTDISLGKLPDISLGEIDTINYSADKSIMFSSNEDISKAQSDYDNLKKGYTLQNSMTLTEAANTLAKAKSDSELAFKSAYDDMVKSYNGYKSDIKAIADAKTKLASLELQYKFGKVSKSAVDDQKDAIAKLEYTLSSTQLSVYLKLQNYKQLKLDKINV